MTIDWKNAPSGATHYAIENNRATWLLMGGDSLWRVLRKKRWILASGLPRGAVKIPKRLTQAVFNGLPPEYRWAAVDANAKACAYTDDPEHDEEIGIFGYFNCTDRAGADYIEIGYGYDATDWQNSKIEREEVTVPDVMQSIANKLIGGWAECREKREESGQIPEAELSSLRTQAVADAAEIERLKVGHDRYEILRRLNVVQFQALYTRALQSPIPFDELVDILGDL